MPTFSSCFYTGAGTSAVANGSHNSNIGYLSRQSSDNVRFFIAAFEVAGSARSGEHLVA